MSDAAWTLSLLISDGRSPCHRSTVRGSDLDQLLPALLAALQPPPPQTSRPVWIRLDAHSPDLSPQRVAALRQALQRWMLPSPGIDRSAQEQSSHEGAAIQLFVDLSRGAVAASHPLIEAQERARAWLLRQLEQQEGTSIPLSSLLTALLLVQANSDSPDLLMAIDRLSRTLLQDHRQHPDRGRAESFRRLAALALPLGQQPQRHGDVAAACRGLLPAVLAPAGHGASGVSGIELVSLALAQSRGLGDQGLDGRLQELLAQLQQSSGGAPARCSALLSLVVLAEADQLRWSITPQQIQSVAALQAPQQVRSIGAALRAVLMLRLSQILQQPGPLGGTHSAWRAAAEAVLLQRHCTPAQAIEADDPQQVLGSFGGSGRLPASLGRQLLPLLTLHHLLQLPTDHASA